MLKKNKILSIKDIKIGDKASFKVKITGTLINEFAGLIRDYSSLHGDENYAKKAGFNKRIAHGMLVGSFFSTLIGMYLPGEKSLIVSQEIKYLKPVFEGDELEIVGVVKNVSLATRLVEIDIKVYKAKKVVVSSKNLVLLR